MNVRPRIEVTSTDRGIGLVYLLLRFPRQIAGEEKLRRTVSRIGYGQLAEIDLVAHEVIKNRVVHGELSDNRADRSGQITLGVILPALDIERSNRERSEKT